ncbi:MAG: phosphoribosylaminoimidazole carboxylase, ATPase subunit [Chloroflexi bacterium]|nr:phosphoribosylaminoimidazole carboxylase, ATPase subunit [Chloroflexota bacterium]
MTVLGPGSTIGMLGGGQLGRMTTIAARQMGYRVVTLDPTPGSPAAQVADEQIVGRYDDPQAVAAVAAKSDVVTLEFENLSAKMVERLETLLPVRPGGRVLRIAQNRLLEKAFLRDVGVPVAPFAPVHDKHALAEALQQVGLPAVLKTATMGYDGKGQYVVRTAEEAQAAYAALRVDCILERLVPFERELSVIVARDVMGRIATYEPAENVHAAGILDTSMTPARIGQDVAQAAREIGARVAESLELVGVLAVELFLTAGGALLANEIAPRPHNSGHWSIEASMTSQFEHQARVTIGGPVGPTDLLRPAATANLMGDLWAAEEPQWDRLLAMPDVKLHLYGKAEPRPGRKMGHLTALAASPVAARERVLAARAALEGRD